jgi:hypothetical protein
MLDSLLTEQRNPASAHIDTLSTADMLRVINQEDARVAEAVREEIPNIAKAVDAIVRAFSDGGRLFYIGAGTSGRLGVLDASECPPTYNVPADLIQLDPASFPQLYFYSAVAHYNMHDLGDAEKRARDGMKMDTAHRLPKTTQLLGYILAEKGDLEGAAQQMKDYLAMNPPPEEVEQTKASLAKLEAQISAKAK